MKQNRDCSIIKHMLQYCERINEAVGFFGKEYEVFKENNIYKDAVALSILQIGELSGVLTDEFKGKYNKMPWRQIKALRNIVAHRYGTIDPEVIWEIVNDDIPELEKYCKMILAEMEK